MNKSFEIKICGINDLPSMTTALDCKVDYIGLVYFKGSPRNVSFEFSKKLLKNRNKKSKIVALTVNPDNNLISDIIINTEPDFIQLHGQETPERCKEIKDLFNVSIIKGIGIENKKQLITLAKKYEHCSDIILLDAPSSKLPGGNGSQFNWDILKDFDYTKKWMLAGGIKYNNVKEAIKITNPPAIDISSGVEIQKGIKSSQLIKEFVKHCRSI